MRNACYNFSLLKARYPLIPSQHVMSTMQKMVGRVEMLGLSLQANRSLGPAGA